MLRAPCKEFLKVNKRKHTQAKNHPLQIKP
jgi:hypothetical protein